MLFTLKQINEKLLQEYNYNLKMYFNEDFSIHKIMKNHLDMIIKNIQDNKTTISIGFEELADFYLLVAIHSQAYSNDKEKINYLFNISSWYSKNLLTIFNKKCSSCHMSIVLMRKAIYLWATVFLVKDYEEAIIIGNELIDSINAKGSIIRYGNRFHVESWFLIDLFSKAFSTPYSKKRADYPEDMKGYEKILEKWDTTDLTTIDNIVSELIEKHLFIEENKDNDENTSEYMFFNNASMKIYFYEVIIFLGIREIKGLENPKEFSHPLMQSLLIQMFLNNKKSKIDISDIPYEIILMNKIKQKCLDLGIDGQNKNIILEENPTSQIINRLDVAQKSASYEAILPPNHPDSLKLKESAFAYLYYEKDVAFSYEGLEEFDISLIKWIEKEE